MTPSSRVLIIQEFIPAYRVTFFMKLHRALRENGITLRVAYSTVSNAQRPDLGRCKLPVEFGVEVVAMPLMGGKGLVQWVTRELLWADLVIVEQANKHAVNYLLVLLSALRLKRFAYWGHGRNWQVLPSSKSEHLKRVMARRADWWFAYTRLTTDYLATVADVDPARITTVHNSVDTRSLIAGMAGVSERDMRRFLARQEIPGCSLIGLYCGGFYQAKQLPLLMAALPFIRRAVPDFHFVFAGDGLQRELVEAFVRKFSWVHYCGSVAGLDKYCLFKAGAILLNPGVVGLSILDGFAAGLPIVTTDSMGYGPETDYLKAGENGLITPATAAAYGNQVSALLQDAGSLQRMSECARRTAMDYTLENMVARFSAGICAALTVST